MPEAFWGRKNAPILWSFVSCGLYWRRWRATRAPASGVGRALAPARHTHRTLLEYNGPEVRRSSRVTAQKRDGPEARESRRQQGAGTANPSQLIDRKQFPLPWPKTKIDCRNWSPSCGPSWPKASRSTLSLGAGWKPRSTTSSACWAATRPTARSPNRWQRRLGESAVGFEASHPTLAVTVSGLIDALGNLGI